MQEQKSQFLHCLRWISALLVAIGHSQLIGGGGDAVFQYLASHAHAAVMVFFVLSGYVITATVDERMASGYGLQQYLVDRISRIYSVLLPAIILTLCLDLLGAHFFPARYSDPQLLPPQAHGIVNFLANALCLQELWDHRVQFGSNSALWSVGYEFFYYMIFGLFVWRPRNWRLFVAAGFVLVGPRVVLYGLIWMLGALAYRVNKAGKCCYFLPALGLCLLANHFLEYRAVVGLPGFVRDFLFAISVVPVVVSAPRISPRSFQVNRGMAEFSYSHYAYHMPIMFMGYSLIAANPVTAWLMVVISLLCSRVLYYFTEHKRGALKSALLKIKLPGSWAAPADG